jgi:ABC-type uncharacterized transport system ATPase component
LDGTVEEMVLPGNIELEQDRGKQTDSNASSQKTMVKKKMKRLRSGFSEPKVEPNTGLFFGGTYVRVRDCTQGWHSFIFISVRLHGAYADYVS